MNSSEQDHAQHIGYVFVCKEITKWVDDCSPVDINNLFAFSESTL